MANRLFNSNKDLPEVSAINWKLTVIEGDVVNAAAFPVKFDLFILNQLHIDFM